MQITLSGEPGANKRLPLRPTTASAVGVSAGPVTGCPRQPPATPIDHRALSAVRRSGLVRALRRAAPVTSCDDERQPAPGAHRLPHRHRSRRRLRRRSAGGASSSGGAPSAGPIHQARLIVGIPPRIFLRHPRACCTGYSVPFGKAACTTLVKCVQQPFADAAVPAASGRTLRTRPESAWPPSHKSSPRATRAQPTRRHRERGRRPWLGVPPHLHGLEEVGACDSVRTVPRSRLARA